MDSIGFFIDTGGKEDISPVDEEETVEALVEDEVMGAKDAQTEAKQRNRARTERSLSTFLFGKTADIIEEAEEDSSSEDEGDEAASERDSESDSEDEDKENEVQPVSVQPSLPEDTFGAALSLSSGKRKRKAAWVDKEDNEVLVKDVTATYNKAVGKHGEKETSIEQYGKSLTRKFKSVVGEPAWASLDKDEDADSDDEFLRETTDLVEKKGRVENLQKGTLQFRKLKDLNYTTHKEGAVVRSTEFHPTSTVGMVAGNNGTVSLFQVDGKENPKIQTVNFQNFPIKTAKFSASGNEFIVGSQHHPHFFVYDMMIGKSIKVPVKTTEHNTQKFEVSRDGKLIAFVGRFGFIHIISARTKEFLRSFKMNDPCLALKFSPDSSSLYTTGEGGEVYIWDLRSSSCLHKFADSGCLAGTAVAVSQHHLATGSSSGVVNVYNVNNIAKGTTAYPQPDKVILNLTTQIEDLVFNPSGEILAMSSMEKEGAVKLVHFPSTTVFSNFPGTFNLGRANTLSFSPGGGYFGVGNNKGAANLYRVNHYQQY